MKPISDKNNEFNFVKNLAQQVILSVIIKWTES